jgi:glycosyltransferase involved in cell wall biosynthesis
MPKFTIITTCKGRLGHLKQTLPQFLKQPDTKVVVVDYSCPERSGAWVRENCPEALVVEVPGQEYFRANEARNTGAAAAQSPFLIFLDADSLISNDFVHGIERVLEEGVFLRLRYPQGNDLNGACVVPAASHRAVQGYDEVIEGYGGEEQEFYWRLRRMGLKARYLPAEGLCEPIRHDNQSRIAYQTEKNMRKAFLQVRGYRLCKEALLGVVFTPELAVAQRKELWHTVQRAIESGGDDIRITVPHPAIKPGFLSDWDMSRVVQVRMRRRHGGEN